MTKRVVAHFKSIVDGFGINNEEADSGKKAVHLTNLAKKTHRPYDIIFLDYDLPDMSGIEVVKEKYLSFCLKMRKLILILRKMEILLCGNYNPEKYDVIIMDVQIPEMDGYR